MESKQINVLICGGSGYIGSSFAHYLLRNPCYKIVVVDNLSNGWYIDRYATAFYKADIGDYNMMRDIIKRHCIDVVFHFCAYIEVNESVRNPLKYYNNNIGNSVKLLEACIDENCYNFVFSSTAAVYGEPLYTPIDENHKLKPINPYGRTKKYFERILKDLNASNENFNYVSLRYFNVAGALEGFSSGEAHFPETHLIPNILDAAIEKQKFITIFGNNYDTSDGTCIRDYIHMEDLCNAHELAMKYLLKNKRSDVFNLGTGSGYSIKKVIETVKKVTKKDFCVIEGERREGDPAILVASNSKARKELNWSPMKTLEDIVRSSYNWHLLKDKTVPVYKIFKEKDLIGEYRNIFNSFDTKNLKLSFAPGRINFIGEHTDYNGGFVLPCAIDKGTYALGQLNRKDKIRVYSSVFDQLSVFTVDKDFKAQIKNDWSDHICATFYILDRLKKIEHGFDIYYYSNMPLSGGMSSSSSVIIATLLLCDKLLGLGIEDKMSLVNLALKVEHEGLDVNCGIMDQYTIVYSKKNNFILLNCLTQKTEMVPIDLGIHKILIGNTNYKRNLKEGKYNERVAECHEILKLLQTVRKAKNLSDYNIEDLQAIKKILTNDMHYRRVKHVVTENRRVIDVVEALKKGDYPIIGKLLNESHFSLKNDYEVTGNHLDTLADEFQSCKGVLGARMMGAGFGGCVIALVESSEIENIISHVRKQYLEKTKIEPSFYQFDIGDGAYMLDY